MEVDATTLTLISGLLVIIAMLMGLMLQILRRLDGPSERVEANTTAINVLAARLDTRTAKTEAKIDTRAVGIDATIDTRTAEILAAIAVNRERIDLNRERTDDNGPRIDSLASGLRSLATGFGEFRIETRENFDQIRTRLDKLEEVADARD